MLRHSSLICFTYLKGTCEREEISGEGVATSREQRIVIYHNTCKCIIKNMFCF
jgi:hypothetical protein